MTPTARKSRRSGFLQDENPQRSRKNFPQDLFCEAHEKLSPQDKTQKPNRAENDPRPQEKLRERPPKTLPSFPEMPEK